MGSGIGLAAALSHFPVILFDTNSFILNKSKEAIRANLNFLVEKKKITAPESDIVYNNILFTSSIHECIADLVVEAIIEDLPAKIELFKGLCQINKPGCILASNTSSLSISKIQSYIDHPHRVAGMHFFNPAQIMKLVEVVKGELTSEEVINNIINVTEKLGKTAVICKDSPGFIVNRIARHYYLEAMRLVELNIATVENVDDIMEASGFKMGPFRLMDLIGMDINLAVSESLYQALHAERLKPSQLQVNKVLEGNLGRKSGKGFYQY